MLTHTTTAPPQTAATRSPAESVPSQDGYGQELAQLQAAELAVRRDPCPELQLQTLLLSELVLAARVRRCQALLDAGEQLPERELRWLTVDQQLHRIRVR